MTSEEEQQPRENPVSEQSPFSAHRVADRWLPRIQHFVDERLDSVRDRLDAWNRRLADQALPAERRDRVRKLSEKKGRKGYLRVVSRDSEDRTE